MDIGASLMRLLIYSLFMILLFGCGKTADEEAHTAIQQAKYHLTHKRCDKALEALSGVSGQSNNPYYHKILASAHACKAGYSELTAIFGGNLGNVDANSIFGSFAGFTTSNETSADSNKYKSLFKAIRVLLNSSSGKPSAVKRNKKFGPRHATDINIQALYMIMIQMGKYFAYYGNTDSDGVKGLGPRTNNCMLGYNNGAVLVALQGAGSLGSCEDPPVGPVDIPLTTTASSVRRMCEGITLFANFLDILGNIDLGDNDQLSALDDINTSIQDLIQIAKIAEGAMGATTDAVETFSAETSQTSCETAAVTDLARVQVYFFLMFETNFL
jgi:hypothetical protein